VPESKPRKKTVGAEGPSQAAQAYKPNPVWFKPVMFGLMIIGLLWIITFYISEGALPVQAWESWNIVAGFGIAIIGFLMTTRWRS
jgi:Cell division protein CrgA